MNKLEDDIKGNEVFLWVGGTRAVQTDFHLFELWIKFVTYLRIKISDEGFAPFKVQSLSVKQ